MWIYGSMDLRLELLVELLLELLLLLLHAPFHVHFVGGREAHPRQLRNEYIAVAEAAPAAALAAAPAADPWIHGSTSFIMNHFGYDEMKSNSCRSHGVLAFPSGRLLQQDRNVSQPRIQHTLSNQIDATGHESQKSRNSKKTKT